MTWPSFPPSRLPPSASGTVLLTYTALLPRSALLLTHRPAIVFSGRPSPAHTRSSLTCRPFQKSALSDARQGQDSPVLPFQNREAVGSLCLLLEAP